MPNPWPEHLIGLAKEIVKTGDYSLDGIMADAMTEIGLPLVAMHFIQRDLGDHWMGINFHVPRKIVDGTEFPSAAGWPMLEEFNSYVKSRA